MCTGIIHIYRCCQCNSVVFKLQDAVGGYTCHQAREYNIRGACKNGINWSHYDRRSEEECLFCEVYLGHEISTLNADTCKAGGEPLSGDIDAVADINTELSVDCSNLPGVNAEDDDSDDDDEDGGAKLY
ncbi:hypothetical protein F5Y03DRAFT_255958 [Xylaria venustula]|nr:hypothetical protein F5Y03DRAFT_255958 [Xylaria venustula]